MKVSLDKLPYPTIENINEIDLSNYRDFLLIGCSSHYKHLRTMSDCLSILSLKMSELLEHALEKALNSGPSNSSSTSATSDKSSSSSGGGLFGWFGGSGTKKTSSTSDKEKESETNRQKKELQDKLLKIRVILAPYKVRYALQLADYGLMSGAVSYINQALSVVKEVNIIGRNLYFSVFFLFLVLL
jgi:hypothetical protein